MSKDVFLKRDFSVVEGEKDFIRDNHSKAIINNNESERAEFRKKRRFLKQKMNEIKILNEEQQEKICTLEKEVENLKILMNKFLEGGK